MARRYKLVFSQLHVKHRTSLTRQPVQLVLDVQQLLFLVVVAGPVVEHLVVAVVALVDAGPAVEHLVVVVAPVVAAAGLLVVHPVVVVFVAPLVAV